MFSPLSRRLAIVPLFLPVVLIAPAQAADYGGTQCCGAIKYDYGKSSGDGDYFISDTDFSKADPNENFSLRGSVGFATIETNEKVFSSIASDDLLSLLNWQTTAPIATLDGKVRFPDNWTLRGHIDASMGGDSSVTDYDWLAGYDPENWTDRSISPNTNLDWYLNGSLAVGRDLPINNDFTINVNTGFKYTDAKWTAVGGSYIYSVANFRDTAGNFANTPVGDFRVQLPEVFVGADANVKDGPWTLEAGAKAGLTIKATDTDTHFLRSIRFFDKFSWAQMYSADARVGFAINEHLSAFLEGSYETLLSTHGDTDINDMNTGELVGHSDASAGVEMKVAAIKVGLKGNF